VVWDSSSVWDKKDNRETRPVQGKSIEQKRRKNFSFGEEYFDPKGCGGRPLKKVAQSSPQRTEDGTMKGRGDMVTIGWSVGAGATSWVVCWGAGDGNPSPS